MLDIRSISTVSATMMIVVAAICSGMAPWFAKSLTDTGFASVAVAFFRFLTSALLLLPILNLSSGGRRATLWAIAAGIALGLGWIGYVEALKNAPVSTVGVIYMTYPFFTLLFAWLWLGQPLALRSVAAGLLILFAASIALSPSLEILSAFPALLYAFSAPLSFGFAICVLTSRLVSLAPLERTAGVSVGATLGLLPLILALEAQAILPPQAEDWALVVGISVITALLPNVLFGIAAPLIGPARTASAGSIELPTMFIVGWLAFGEQIGILKFMAGALVVAAIVMTPTIRENERS